MLPDFLVKPAATVCNLACALGWNFAFTFSPQIRRPRGEQGECGTMAGGRNCVLGWRSTLKTLKYTTVYVVTNYLKHSNIHCELTETESICKA